MEHPLRMSRREPGAELMGDFDDPLGRQTTGAPEKGREILSPHELHRKEDRLASFSNIEDPTHRGVCDLPRESDLLQDALAF